MGGGITGFRNVGAELVNAFENIEGGFGAWLNELIGWNVWDCEEYVGDWGAGTPPNIAVCPDIIGIALGDPNREGLF